VNVYDVPPVNPVIVIGELEPAAVIPPGELVTRYEDAAGTPRSDGAVKETIACPAPAVAETLVGVPGSLSVLTDDEVAENGPFP
jgi:hypothetical protein